MKYRYVLSIVAILVSSSVTTRSHAFDSFYRLVADTSEVGEAIQHGAQKHGAVQHAKAYHDGVGQKSAPTQKCAPVQKSAPTQKCAPAKKCGPSQKSSSGWGLGWAHKFGISQKGDCGDKCGSAQKTAPIHSQKSCRDTKGGCDVKGGCAPGLCHLQGCAVRLKCAALNFHSSFKAHCEIAKMRLCAPLCSCGSKCDGKCGGYEQMKYADDVGYIK